MITPRIEPVSAIHFIDRTGWDKGPWDTEHDKVHFIDRLTGYDCLVRRHSTKGYLCGYVGVPVDHPLHGKDSEGMWELEAHNNMVNYAAPCSDQENGICHVPTAGRPDDVWWIGFHCAGTFDYEPNSSKSSLMPACMITEVTVADYRNMEYVQQETLNLSEQLYARRHV